jgi:hypothetical protein
MCSNHNDVEGCYTPEDIEAVHVEMSARADRFNTANCIQNMMEKMHHFRGDHFPEPIYGAFGEEL